MSQQKFVIRSLWVLALIGLLLLAPACQRSSQLEDQASELSVSLSMDPQPAAVGATTLTVEINEPNGSPVEGAEVEVRGDMTHAGMVPVLGEATETAPGLYEVPFEWSMGGDWILTVTAELPDGRLLQRTFEQSVSSEEPMDMEMDETSG